MRAILAATALSLVATVAMAEDVITYDTDASFDDAAFALENAITNEGLVVDYVSHVGDMLNRTGEDVGSDVEIFAHANVYLFCSAVISRQVMEADPMNIVHCPYNIFVAERDGAVVYGHRDYPDGAMDVVEELLAKIVENAKEF